MNKIRHFICIRFLAGCCDIINDSAYQTSCFNLIQRNSFSSLNRSNNHEFEVILITNKQFISTINAWKAGITCKFPVIVIPYDEAYANLHNYIKQNATADVIITSNLDYDDFIRYDAIEQLHSYAKTVNDFSLYGLPFGATVSNNDGTGYLFRADWFLNTGFMSVLDTFIYHTKYNSNNRFPHSIYDMNVKYGTDHTFYKKCIEKHYKEWGLKHLPQNYFFYNKYERNIQFLWYRHNHSWSHMKDGTMHTSNIQMIINPDDFGYHVM